MFIEDLNIVPSVESRHPLVNEFSQDLINDDNLFERAMNDLYLNPKASKYLDNFSEFDRRTLIQHAENLLKEDMGGE